MSLITRANIPLSAARRNPGGALLQQALQGAQLGNVLTEPFRQQQAQEQQDQTNALAQTALGVDQSTPEQQRNALAQIASTDPQRAQQLLGFQQEVFNTLNASDDQAKRSMITGALEASLSNDPVSVLRRRSESLRAAGRDSSDTDAIIARFESGDAQGAKDALTSAISFGQQTGVLKSPSAQESTTLIKNLEAAGIERGSPEFKQAVMQSVLDVPTGEQVSLEREKLDIRRAEQRQRSLDRQLSRETNELKRRELENKISESERLVESAKREQEFNEESSLATVDDTIRSVDGLIESPGLTRASGIEANIPITIAGSHAANFEAKLETLQSQAFLSQVEKLRGLGALSENEGKKLSSAIGALNTSMSDDAMLKSLKEIKRSLEEGKKRLEKKFGRESASKESGDRQIRTIGRFQVEVE